MRFLNIFRKDESPELRQLRELYQSSEHGEPLPDTSPEVRQEFEAQQQLQTRISQLASSASPENASAQRGALLSRLAEKRNERQSKEVLPMFGQLFKGRTIAAGIAGLLLIGVVATAGASNTAGHVTGSVGDVLDTLQITQRGPDTAGVEQQDEDAGPPSWVFVCHVPDDDPENPFSLILPDTAVAEHLEHGDTEGLCAGDDGPRNGPLGDGPPGPPDGVGPDGDVGPPERVLVCHVPEDPETAPFTLLLPEGAVEEHIGHGDTEGACADSPEPRNGPPFDVPQGEGNGPPFDVPRGTPDGEDNGPPFDVPRGEGNGPPFDVPRGTPDGIEPIEGEGDNGPPFDLPVGGGEENDGPPFDLPNRPTGE